MITIIIPTIGRSSLKNTIQSLINQTNQEWRAIIVFDGILCNLSEELRDSRIQVLECEKKGNKINSAGNVRNYGIRHVTTTWVGFVDDDDILSERYVETFYKEIQEYLNTDVILFRMYTETPSHLFPTMFFIPELNTDNFYRQKTGISFALKTSIFINENHWFIPSEEEDYEFLNGLRDSHIIMISPFVRYFVRCISDNLLLNEITMDAVIGNRLILSV